MSRLRRVLLAVAPAAGLMTGLPAWAAYPEKPVTVIVAWPAGGATDLMSRVLQEPLARSLGTQVIIKNVVGAAGTIGSAEAASAAPDGYTILISPVGPMVIQPQRMKLTYELASFAPVCKLVDSPMVLMSPPGSRFKTVKDIVDAAKADPGKLAYASTGPGTMPHMSMLGFAKASGTQLKHVPYKGSADVVQSMLSGTIELFADQPNLVPQYNLTPIAVFAEKRIPGYNDTPTAKEAGFDLKFSIWNAIFAPKGTPEPVLARLEAACQAAVQDKGAIEALEKQRQPIDFRDRKGLAAFVADEYKNAKVLIEEAGLKQP